MTDKLKKVDVVSKYDPTFESYVSVDNEDNFIDIVEPKNMPGRVIMVYKSCELLGVWHWVPGMEVEEFIEMLYVNNLQED